MCTACGKVADKLIVSVASCFVKCWKLIPGRACRCFCDNQEPEEPCKRTEEHGEGKSSKATAPQQGHIDCIGVSEASSSDSKNTKETGTSKKVAE